MARILVVDDEELVRAAIATVLRRAGHLVTLAEDGEDALGKFAAGQYDVVITDIVMPRKEGIETVRALRRLDPGIRIIAISGSGGADHGFYLKAAAALGANATFQKPFHAAELRQTVEAVLAAPAAPSEVLWYRQADRVAPGARMAEPEPTPAKQPVASEARFHEARGKPPLPRRIKL